MNAFVTIQEILQSYANERGDYSPSNLKRFERILLEGYADLNINFATVNYTTGIVNEANILKLPADFVDYLKIGLLKDGQIWTLTENKDLAVMRDVCGVEVNDDFNKNAFAYPWMTDYTRGGGWNVGKYRVDKSPDNRRIVFSGAMMGCEVHIEYISTGIKEGQTYVPVELMTTLKAYLDWILKKRDDNMPMGKIEMARRDYLNAKAEWFRGTIAMTYDEILDTIRNGYSQGPKR